MYRNEDLRPLRLLKAGSSDWCRWFWECFPIGCSCPRSISGDWWSEMGLRSQAVQKREGLHGVASVFHHPATAHIWTQMYELGQFHFARFLYSVCAWENHFTGQPNPDTTFPAFSCKEMQRKNTTKPLNTNTHTHTLTGLHGLCYRKALGQRVQFHRARRQQRVKGQSALRLQLSPETC